MRPIRKSIAVVQIVLATSTAALGQTPSLPPGVETAPSGSKVTVDIDKLFGGNALHDLVSSFDDDTQRTCLRATGLLTVAPHGASILLPARRDELGIDIQESTDLQRNRRLFQFVTPSCRLTISIEKDVANGTSWVPLVPKQ
jgi:hypothetical protein